MHGLIEEPLYLGQVRHKTEIYPGEHAAIIDQEPWDKAQALLDENFRGKRRKERSTRPSLFTGIIFDADASHAKKIFPIAFLSPSCTELILRFNTDFTLKALLANIPMEWSRQTLPPPLHSPEQVFRR